MNKMPYIPNKKMYAAVMGACSYIRATGYFNKATQFYADKYGVDVDEVRKYVRARQSVGQKGTKRGEYKFFAIEYSMGNERNGCDFFEKEFARYTIKKGLSKHSVIRSICKDEDNASEYEAIHQFGRFEEFNTLQEARKRVREWQDNC